MGGQLLLHFILAFLVLGRVPRVAAIQPILGSLVAGRPVPAAWSSSGSSALVEFAIVDRIETRRIWSEAGHCEHGVQLCDML
jgi:hypothetical protein